MKKALILIVIIILAGVVAIGCYSIEKNKLNTQKSSIASAENSNNSTVQNTNSTLNNTQTATNNNISNTENNNSNQSQRQSQNQSGNSNQSTLPDQLNGIYIPKRAGGFDISNYLTVHLVPGVTPAIV